MLLGLPWRVLRHHKTGDWIWRAISFFLGICLAWRFFWFCFLALLLCFSAFLLPCFSAFLLPCFSAFLLLCFSASLLFCFSNFYAFTLLCFSAFLFPCFQQQNQQQQEQEEQTKSSNRNSKVWLKQQPPIFTMHLHVCVNGCFASWFAPASRKPAWIWCSVSWSVYELFHLLQELDAALFGCHRR